MSTTIYFYEHPFPFEPFVEGGWEGRLILDEELRALFMRLRDAEDDWYLDDHGDRLPPDALFERTPWSWRSPTGEVTKLLLRFFDGRDGRARFNSRETYFGALYDWFR